MPGLPFLVMHSTELFLQQLLVRGIHVSLHAVHLVVLVRLRQDQVNCNAQVVLCQNLVFVISLQPEIREMSVLYAVVAILTYNIPLDIKKYRNSIGCVKKNVNFCNWLAFPTKMK